LIIETVKGRVSMNKGKLLMASDRPKFGVVSPLGEQTGQNGHPLAPRLDTLDGKTVCEIWNRDFRGDETFAFIREMLLERYPSVKVIPFTELPITEVPVWAPNAKAKTAEAVRVALAAKGCNAVITGNGA
jgi:hypothetical protein